MRTQRLNVYLAGTMVTGPAATRNWWPPVAVQQTITELDFVCNGDVPVGVPAEFAFLLGQVQQAGVYSLPIGEIVGANTANLTVPLGIMPGVICTQGGGASEITAWITITDAAASYSTDPWVDMTVDDIAVGMSAQELAAWDSALLKTGQGQPIAQLIDTTIKEARGYVARGGNIMGLEGTIPCELVGVVRTIVIGSVFRRTQVIGEIAVKLEPVLRAAYETLERVAKGDMDVSLPVMLAANAYQATGRAEVVRASLPRRFSQVQQSGLL